MGHSVTVLLGTHEVLSALAEGEAVSQPVEAKAGIWLLPLTEDVLDKVTGLPVGEPLPGFTYLSPKLLAKLELASFRGWIVYAETDYFGGTGGQGAVAVRNGSSLYGPENGEWGCINRALSRVGIRVVPPAFDEFETVGLHLQRFTVGWLPGKRDRDA
jgi:hypothetical protein